MDHGSSGPLLITYKVVGNVSLHIDVYPPSPPPVNNDNSTKGTPVVLYFHGGGMTVGDRKSWFPTWLCRRLCAAGIAFASADYRLLLPCTGHDSLEDVKDLFTFVANDINPVLNEELASRRLPSFHINPNAIAVAGTSAGGLCAYLSAIHATPKPVALLSMYGMGGNFLTHHYLKPKAKPFFRGREILDPDEFREYLFPKSHDLPPIAQSPLAYHPQDSPIPGLPANPRMFLIRLFLQLGTFLDYYTGDHLSENLRRSLDSDGSSYSESDIPPNHLPLFPQFGVTSRWPPSILVHGAADTSISVQESHHLRNLLTTAGVDVLLRVVEGQEHSFDYEPNVEELHHGLFDDIVTFLASRLKES